MPRQRSPNRDKAKELYISGKGKILLKDIAEQLNISDTQIRKWKSQDKWDEELKGNVTKTKSNVTKQKKGINIQPLNELNPEDIETLEADGLNEKQRLFCLLYSRTFNATKSYQKVYGVSYQVAMACGPRLLGKDRIKAEIMKLKQERCKRDLLTKEDIFQKYMDIAFADLNDYIEFGQEETIVMSAFGPVMEDGNPVTKMVNTVRFKESDEVDGTILSEVKKGKDGVSIKLADRMKALEWLADHIGWATDEQKAKVELLQAQKKKLEIEEPEEMDDDGFMDALNASAKEDWNEES